MSRTVIVRGAKTSREWPPGARELLAYKVELDTSALDTMAKKAARNRRGVSRMGALVVTITNRKAAPL